MNHNLRIDNYKLSGIKKIVLILISQLITLFFATSSTNATDLTIVKFNSPQDSIVIGEIFKIGFKLANTNVQPALEYWLRVFMTDENGNSVFSLDTVGSPISPFTERDIIIDNDLSIFNSGNYNIKVLVDFDEEINRGNDTLSKSFVVYNPVKPLSINTELFFHHYSNPTGMPINLFGHLRLTYPPQDEWKYVNYLLTADTTNPEYTEWSVKNALIPVFSDTSRVDVSLSYDLHKYSLQGSDKIYSYLIIDDLPLIDLDKISGWNLQNYNYDTLNISNGLLLESSTNNTQISQAPKPQINAPISDTTYRGCNVPNLDLNSKVYNPSTITNYAGDENACAPVSAANSMQWLEDNFSNIRTGLSHRNKLIWLSKLMNRENNKGVFIRDFIQGKLAFINKYKLPIRVKFQVFNEDGNIDSPDRIENDAINRGDGKYPTWNFLKKEMKDEEDVEMFIEYHRKIGNNDEVRGRHAITASGVAETAGNKILWYKDDSDQDKEGGNTEKQVKWDTLSNGTPIIDSVQKRGDTTWYTSVYGIVSESYDSTVVFKEKGKLQRLWDGLKGFGRFVTNTDIIEVGAPNQGYLNIMARKDENSIPKWIIRNYPIQESEINTSLFFDLVQLGLENSVETNRIQSKIIYSEDFIELTPNINSNDWFWYNCDNINIEQSISSVDDYNNNLDIEFRVNDLPEYSPSSPTISDDFSVNLGNSFIDLISDQYNPSTVSNYKGDQNALGLSSFAALIKSIDNNLSQIDLGMNSREILYGLDSFTDRQAEKGVYRNNLIKALLNFIDNKKSKINVVFQSTKITDEKIYGDSLFGHFAENKNDSEQNPSFEFLANEIKNNRYPAIEFAWYDNSGRKFGSWAIVKRVFKQKGIEKLEIVYDEDIKGPGGLINTFITMFRDAKGNNHLVEFSDNEAKCILESIVTLGYDPSMIFSSVSNEDIYVKNLLSIKPNPSNSSSGVLIQLEIPNDDSVIIQLFDMLGNKISDIYEGSVSKGLMNLNHTFDLNLGSGIYTITVVGNKFRSSEKIVIMN